MCAPLRCLSLTAFFLVLLTVASPRAWGDTYVFKSLGSIPDSNLWGITASGTVVIEAELGIPDDIAYLVFPVDGPSYEVGDPPPFTYDDGTFGCTPVTSAGVTWDPDGGSTTCNGSREEYVGYYTPAGSLTQTTGVFTGPSLSDLFAGPGIPDLSSYYVVDVFLNSAGDFVWPGPGGYDEAIDVGATAATPEPGTLLLVASGAAALLGAWRRRLARG